MYLYPAHIVSNVLRSWVKYSIRYLLQLSGYKEIEIKEV